MPIGRVSPSAPDCPGGVNSYCMYSPIAPGAYPGECGGRLWTTWWSICWVRLRSCAHAHRPACSRMPGAGPNGSRDRHRRSGSSILADRESRKSLRTVQLDPWPDVPAAGSDDQQHLRSGVQGIRSASRFVLFRRHRISVQDREFRGSAAGRHPQCLSSIRESTRGLRAQPAGDADPARGDHPGAGPAASWAWSPQVPLGHHRRPTTPRRPTCWSPTGTSGTISYWGADLSAKLIRADRQAAAGRELLLPERGLLRRRQRRAAATDLHDIALNAPNQKGSIGITWSTTPRPATR